MGDRVLAHDDRSRAGVDWRAAGPYAAIFATVLIVMGPALAAPPMLQVDWPITLVWSRQFTDLVEAGTLLPRWLPDAFGGLGAPTFYFYPPVAYYVAAAFAMLGMSTYASVMCTYAVAFAAGGVGAYRLFKATPAPLAGAIFFTAAPYHLLDFAWRGALAESVGIAILPWLALAFRRIAEGKPWWPGAMLYGLLVATHLPFALLATMFFLGPYALFHRRRMLAFLGAGLLGIGLAAFSLGPSLLLEQYRDSTHLSRNPMLRTDHWNLATIDLAGGFAPYVAITLAVLAIAALLLLWAGQRRAPPYGLAILAAATAIVPILWQLPLLERVQFPARIVPFAELAIAAALARAGLARWPVKLAFGLPLLWSAIIASPPQDLYADPRVAIAGSPDGAQHLPPGAYRGDKPVPSAAEITAGRLPPPQFPGWVVEPTFYFPAWTCAALEPRTKLIMHRPGCTPRLEMTPAEWWSMLVSLLSLLLLAAILVRGRRRRASLPLFG